MESIDKKIQKKFNLTTEDIINQTKEEKQQNRINLRKKKIQNIVMRKRYYDNFSNIGIDDNKVNNNNTNKEIDYAIDISKFLIKDDLKKKETVDGILSEKDFNTIFSYINEIYKETNFQIDILKYGLFLLNQKLLKCAEEKGDKDDTTNNEKIIEDIKKHNIEDIINKLLNFSMNEINNKDNDDIILNLAYQILVHLSFFGNESQLMFLVNDNLIKFHKFFLNYTSNEQILINILRMIYNICLNNSLITNKLLNFNNYEIINLLNDYISSGIKSNKKSIINKILDIYSCYTNIIRYDLKYDKNYINIKILEEIYSASLQSIFINSKAIFSNSIFLIGSIYKILFKSNNIKILSEFILNYDNTKLMVSYILDYDYSTSAEDIIDLCNILCYIIKCESHCDDLSTKKQLEKFINDVNDNNINGDEIIIIVTPLLQKNYTKKIKSKLINVLIALCDSETFYINVFECLANPILILINNINCPDYKIRKKVLTALEKLTDKQELKIGNELVKNQIFNEIKNVIDMDFSYCGKEDMIISCLNIIYNLLVIGDIIKSFGGKNNTLEAFENYGGKEMIEKLLNHESKNIYERASTIIKQYFTNEKL
jgi:hypothetical protein